MDLHSMRGLLPFYVNGTLGPEERSLVDQALATSEELRQELRFWQQAARYIQAGSGHLSAQQLVARAQGTSPAGERAHLDEHLADCSTCRDLLLRVESSLSASDTVHTPIHTAWYRHPLWKYAAAAVFASLAILLLVRDTPPAPPDTPVPPRVSPPHTPGARRITSLVLTYRPLMRGSEDPEPTPLSLQDGDSLLHVLFAIPHSSVEGMRYSLWREQGRATRVMVTQDIGRSGRGETYDTVAVDVARSTLPAPHQQIRLIIREELPRGSSGLTPEEYSFEVQGRPAP